MNTSFAAVEYPTMVKRYIERQNLDASPLLGAEKYMSLASRRGGPENIRLNVCVLSRESMPVCNDTYAAGNRPATQRSQLSAMSIMSPLVAPRTTTITTTGTSAASEWSRVSGTGDAQCVRFSVTVAADGSTVEDLAHVIESAYSTQRHLDATRRRLQGASLADGPRGVAPLIICTALFKGRRPLLFGSSVQSVLESGDTVTVYSDVGCDDDDDDDGIDAAAINDADDDDDEDIRMLGGCSPASADSADGEFLFVPLATLPPTPGPSGRSSVVAAAVDTAAVGRIVSQAPLKARFVNVLVHPALLRAFLEFCALPSELALESLLFVLDVERFRHVQPSMARLLANYIYLTYVAASAPLRVNISAQMRGRIAWPFLAGWEYNPWVFDEMLASVGFTLKKHTLLRFERSPVGLQALMSRADGGFSAHEYTRALRFDGANDPMAAVAAQYAPDIDVAMWVNALDVAHVAAELAQLPDAFREQLLARVAAQFVGELRAHMASGGYFDLAGQIRALQKQKRIKKTRKIRSFFGDHPHEALLRAQLLAVVPPSSQRQAARAAAELVARRQRQQAAAGRHVQAALPTHRRGGSEASSAYAERAILAVDSDSDLEDTQGHAWAQQALSQMQQQQPRRQQQQQQRQHRQRSWSDSDSDGSDTWPAAASPEAASRDQTLSRALSMIGVAHGDSPDSEASLSDGERGSLRFGSVRSVGRGLAHVLGTPTLHDRRRRVDRLRSFFGGGSGNGSVVSDAHSAERRGLSNDSAAGDTLRSLGSAHSGGLGLAALAELTAEQRHVLVRRRRKLRALLGEDVVVAGGGGGGGCDGESAVVWPAEPGPPPPPPPYQPPMADQSAAGAPVDEQQRVRAHWRRRKLKAVLGDVPAGVSTVYASDRAGPPPGDASSDGGADDDDDNARQRQQQRRQRVRKLRRFFGQSLGADAARHVLAPVAEEDDGDDLDDGGGGGGDIDGSRAASASFELVPLPRTHVQSPAAAAAAAVEAEAGWRLSAAGGRAGLAGVDDGQQPFRAQFWVTADTSPETPAASPGKRASLIARLRPRRPSASSPRPSAGPPGSPRSPAAGARRRLFARLGERPGEQRSPAQAQALPPPRASSIRPLSPLPPISPNNLQASFDRGVVALGRLDEAAEAQQAFDPPPRMRSANAAGAASAHKHVVAGALVPAAAAHAVSTRSQPRRNAFEAPPGDVRRAPSKTVHWFDGPPPPPPAVDLAADRAGDPNPGLISASAKSSADFGAMSIVLRSPAAATRSVASPVALRPALPIAANASVTAVGGRRACVLPAPAPASAPLPPLLPPPRPPSAQPMLLPASAPLPRRAQSLAAQRCADPAPPAIRLSRSVDLPRRAEPAARAPAAAAGSSSSPAAAGFPRAARRVRRARSLVLATRPAGRHARARCATVVPVRLELQRLLRTTRAQRRPAGPAGPAAPPAPAEPSGAPRRSAPGTGATSTRMSAPPPRSLPRSGGLLRRTRSCPARLAAASRWPRRCVPILPAVMRYLASANARRYCSLPALRRPHAGLLRSASANVAPPSAAATAAAASSPYQRISMARLSANTHAAALSMSMPSMASAAP
ncbi:hypothetical protein LPJ53_004597 [Coemansia erecta]|uniref:RGS domain-containing protein n=1 Tax=Coemansia erecta TaxID=147472 RepID=A0A9W7XU13_9FUNG|nr:hypothetical protein LPJ53_004597 [Coemansia erecta]